LKGTKEGKDRRKARRRRRRGAGGASRRAEALALALVFGCTPAGCKLPFFRKRAEAAEPASVAASAAESSAAAGAAFQGAWFRIVPPPGFAVRPSLKSNSAEGYDSAFFDSPDGRAVFYVCSPQWGRDATDIALQPATESLLSDQSAKSGGESIQQLQMEALDGSYQRLVEIISSAESRAYWVFGFQYADSLTYDEYLDLYKQFKKSLEQFAD
jgi:hypothetical protein